MSTRVDRPEVVGSRSVGSWVIQTYLGDLQPTYIVV